MSNKNDHDIYIIPPNFIESGTFFGGMFRARNVIEAGILAFAIGVPVFMFVPFGLTTRIIILCLTALPAALVALIGISGESLSEFLIIFLKYLRNRRIVGGDGQQPNEQAPPMKRPGRHLKQRAPKEKESRPPKRRRSGESDFPAEFDEVRSYEIREKLRPKKKPKKELSSKKAKKKPNKRKEKARPPKRPAHIKEQPPACLNPVADYLPIEKIQNGIIYTKDHRYVKVVEVVPINFMLRSAREQRNMKKKIIIHIEDLTVPQEVLLQELLQSFCVGQIEVLEDTTSTLLVGDMQIDVERRQVWRAGSQIELTPMEFDILHLLARRPGQVFSARQIYESVSTDFAAGSWSGIGNMVYKLRCKIGTEAIRTVRNCGYSLITRQPSKR